MALQKLERSPYNKTVKATVRKRSEKYRAGMKTVAGWLTEDDVLHHTVLS